MTWIRIDDQFADHPKVVSAGPLAAWLYVCGLSYCSRQLTDGFIPDGQLRKLADVDNAGELGDRLVSVGLWERVEGGFQVHDYLEYQPSAEKVKAERAATAKRQAEWREREREKRAAKPRPLVDKKRNAVSHTVTDTVSNARRNGSVTPSPSHPVPIPNDSEDVPSSVEGETSKSQPFDVLVAVCEELGQDVSVLSGRERSKQCGFAKQLIEANLSIDDARRMVRWLAQQNWVMQGGGVDLKLMAGQVGKWVMQGKPDKPPEIRHLPTARGRPDYDGERNLTNDDLDAIIAGVR
jgi:hypothetical protein